MRIDGTLPIYYFSPQTAMPPRQDAPTQPNRADGWLSPAATVDISPEAWEAYRDRKKVQTDSRAAEGGVKDALAPRECQTCKNRKYVDQSDDPSVSFQAPTNISPGQSASAVMSHEREHVVNEQARAEKEGREVVSQTVTLQMSTCPECGRMYVSGGTTRTVTVAKKDSGEPQINAEIPGGSAV
jgi:hypothetical protein